MTAWALFWIRLLTVLIVAAAVWASWQNTADLWDGERPDARVTTGENTDEPNSRPRASSG